MLKKFLGCFILATILLAQVLSDRAMAWHGAKIKLKPF